MNSTKEIIDNYYIYLQQRDREQLLGLLSADIVVTYHAQEGQFPWAGKFYGIAGFDRFFSMIKEHLDILEVTIVDSIVADNKMVNQCAGRWQYKATGYVVEGSMVNVFTVVDDKITGYEIYADTAAFAVGFEA